MRRFSPWGYLLFTVWGGLLAAVVDGWSLGALALLELVFGMIWSREGLGPLRRLRFWLFILTALALGPFLSETFGLRQGLFPFTREGLAIGLQMAGRAFAMTLAFSLGTSAISLSDLVAMFDRLRLRGLGFAVGLAVNLLGTLRAMVTVTLQTIRLRGGMRRPLVGLRLFLITLVTNTLRCGDQMVDAAFVRAFDPNAGRPVSLPLHWADLGLVIVLAGCSVVLLCHLNILR